MYSYEDIVFDSLVSGVECFVLEQNPEIQTCRKIIETDSLLYLLSYDDMCASVYRKSGEKICNIVNNSKGYRMTPCDIFIHEEEKQLWVIEDREILFKYTLNGEFAEKQKLPFHAVKIARKNKDGYIFFNGGFGAMPCYVVATDEHFNNSESFIYRDTRNKTATMESAFAVCKDKLWIHVPNNDTLYRYDENRNGISAVCRLDFRGDFLTRRDMPEKGYSDKEYAEMMQKNEKILSIKGFHCVNDMLFMKLNGKDNSFRIIQTDNNMVLRFNTLIDGLKQYPQGSSNGALLLVLGSKTVKSYYSKRKNRSAYDSVNRMLDRLTDSDGKVVFKINLNLKNT
jgi:hypothetical protein